MELRGEADATSDAAHPLLPETEMVTNGSIKEDLMHRLSIDNRKDNWRGFYTA